MINFKSRGIYLIVFIVCILIPLFPAATFAANGIEILGNQTWDLIQAFSKSINGQEEWNKRYLIPGLVFFIFLIGIIVYISNTKSKQSANIKRYSPSKNFVNMLSEKNKIKQPEKQQRSWLRLPTDLDFEYTLQKDNLPDNQLSFKKGPILNLSAGGVLFTTNEEPEVNDNLKIILHLPLDKKLSLNGQVVRVLPYTSNESVIYQVGVKFVGIRRGEQDSIVRYVFNRQQELKRLSEGKCIKCGNLIHDEKAELCTKCRKNVEKK